jgi:uncharacterized protein YceH (UPF0502 family)
MDTPATLTSSATPPAAAPHRWQPLVAIDRRVAGVLVEKAKTTPDIYPMTINALVAGCNQKSNRYPQMQVEPEDVVESLDRLRGLGAVVVVQGGSRVDKFRHQMYEWLGVDKAEMAVMTELLLRGAQTEGELRGRAARMEPIADLTALRPIIDSLKAKGLVVGLTPAGRGHVVTHNLYEPRELEKVRAQAAALAGASEGGHEPTGHTPSDVAHRPTASSHPDGGAFKSELEALRRQVAEMRSELADLASEVSRGRHDIDRLKDALGA